MDTTHWLLFDWRMVGRSTTPNPKDVVSQIEEVLEMDGFAPDTARDERLPVTAWSTRWCYRDANDIASVQLHTVWEDEGYWALHVLQFLHPMWSGSEQVSSLLTALQTLPEQAPTPTALPMLRRLAGGASIPRAWSTIVDAPSAAVEAWLRTRVFARLDSPAQSLGRSDTIVIDGLEHWVWAIMAPPSWVSLPSGNWWVLPTTAVVTRPDVAPITSIPPQSQASLAIQIAEYNRRTTIDVHTGFAAHPLLDHLVRCFREGDARLLFPPLVEHDHREKKLVWLAPVLGFPWDKAAKHLQALSGARRKIAELF
jgi:hypothetical protein